MALWLTAAHFLAAVDEDLSARPAQEALYMLAAVGGVLRLVADVAAAEEPDAAARLLPAAATFVDWSWEGVAPSFFVVLSDEAAHLVRVAVVVVLKWMVGAVDPGATTVPYRFALLVLAAIWTVVDVATPGPPSPPAVDWVVSGQAALVSLLVAVLQSLWPCRRCASALRRRRPLRASSPLRCASGAPAGRGGRILRRRGRARGRAVGGSGAGLCFGCGRYAPRHHRHLAPLAGGGSGVGDAP